MGQSFRCTGRSLLPEDAKQQPPMGALKFRLFALAIVAILLSPPKLFADERTFTDEFDLIENDLDRDFVKDMMDRVKERCEQIQRTCLEDADARYCNRLLTKTPGCETLFCYGGRLNRMPAQVETTSVTNAAKIPLPPTGAVKGAAASVIVPLTDIPKGAITVLSAAPKLAPSVVEKPAVVRIDVPKVEPMPKVETKKADGT